METYEIITIILNVFVLILVLLSRSQWLLSIAILVVLIIIIVQKMWLGSKLDETRKNQKDIIDIMGNRLSDFSNRINDIKSKFEKEMFVLNTKLDFEKRDWERYVDATYRDLARKILDVENNLNKIKRTLGAGLGTAEERLNRIETELGIFTGLREREEEAG